MEIKAKILVVDDEIKNVKLLEAQLLPQGYQVIKAYNGAEALQQVGWERPDLIILDIMMPVMDGFETCRRIKDAPDTALIPVVIMTALGAVEDRVKGIDAGADDFLTKPVHYDELQARIRTSLKLKQTVDRQLHTLRQVGDQFSKFVPEAVKRLVTENPDAPELVKQLRDVSVLFLDVVGYTRLNETYDPALIDRLIERYFSAFLDIIHDAGGDITETSGDGMMVVFQDANPHTHPVHAIDAAGALFAATGTLNQENQLEPFALHMGMNSGAALVGSTRYEGRRGSRWIFTADGPVINLAARLAGIAEPGELLLGPGAAQRLADRYSLLNRGPVSLKNISEPVEVFCLPKIAIDLPQK